MFPISIFITPCIFQHISVYCMHRLYTSILPHPGPRQTLLFYWLAKRKEALNPKQPSPRLPIAGNASDWAKSLCLIGQPDILTPSAAISGSLYQFGDGHGDSFGQVVLLCPCYVVLCTCSTLCDHYRALKSCSESCMTSRWPTVHRLSSSYPGIRALVQYSMTLCHSLNCPAKRNGECKLMNVLSVPSLVTVRLNHLGFGPRNLLQTTEYGVLLLSRLLVPCCCNPGGRPASPSSVYPYSVYPGDGELLEAV